ncbi:MULTISPECIES: hypothetical protein [Pseudanabaena]|uniref:beta barrel domain-containing protein n=1 Tax=Pseudanabaena TaxID=1152 RepID=UPI0024791F9F|nr:MULTISPECIES: hypothetical protein [Pseudanabaena]MEA5489584.1 hypothetical protein [Pseudanabaena sp. CCNP1317]WGS75113.1 hypothetical protein OA858_25225 [Pseudanabaena galeata CCNP1313]
MYNHISTRADVKVGDRFAVWHIGGNPETSIREVTKVGFGSNDSAFYVEGIAGHFHFDYALGRIRHDLELQIEIHVVFDSMEQLKLEQRRRKLAYHIRQAAKRIYGAPTLPYSTRQLEAIAKALEPRIR